MTRYDARPRADGWQDRATVGLAAACEQLCDLSPLAHLTNTLPPVWAQFGRLGVAGIARNHQGTMDYQ